ncbi:MAG: HPr family phosphocarrier protein [Gammaproteobacteria bacterium]|nr:MAG: HPr family phosphocarrier protein [Gammaproteobacteria bacterium]
METAVKVARRSVTIANRLGLHARAAAKFVTLATRFDSEISLVRGPRRVNAKSIMGVMMLAAGKGVIVEIEASGSDAEAALNQLEQLVIDRFGEAE